MPDDTPDTPHGPTCPLSDEQLGDVEVATVLAAATPVDLEELAILARRRIALAAIAADRARLREAIAFPATEHFDDACVAVKAKALEVDHA